MGTRNVLGKIAAVVAINTGSVRPSLNSTAKDIERFATTVRSRISSATRASGKAFDDIFTPLQKLQAALKAANQQPLDLKIQNGREIQQAVRAAEQIAKPLANARKEFGALSQGVQASLLPVLQSAQKQATNLFDALSNGAKVSNTDLANTEARVQQLISAFSRARQASQLIRGLGNGQELQFQNPEFVEQARRSAQLQQQASSLTASQLSGSSIVNLIGQQRAAADEAERLRAALDKVRTTRNGDAAAAQAAYSNQLAQLAAINDRIERQIALIQRAAAAEQSAASARSAAQQQVTTQRNSLASASAALTGGIAPQVQDVNEVFSNLTSRAQQARAAVANAFRTPEAADLRNRLAQIAAEVGNIQDEYRTLSAQDPQRREILRWQDLEERVQAVNFRLGAVTSLANQAREALGGVADEFTEAQLQAQRLAAANERLVVDQQESQVLSNEGASSRRATPVPRSVFEEGFARQIRNELGPAITDQQRQFDVLRGSIVSVKGQLDTLPASVRSQFIPAIQQAEAEFQRLRALGPDATAEAIENAANEVDRLGQQLRRVSQVQALPNFAQALDDSAIRGSIGSLNALQQILSRVGAEAGSNAAVQFDRMRAAIQRATADGTIGSQAFQNELREIARDASVAAAETGRIGQGAAFREIQRGGDIARGGFDRLSLATQQAAFAIDDFFSVQGDFSQRIRAVQNNVTQLAFILGGTTGLFIGLGVSIAAQATVALIKWVNGGRTAEDQTKALNDALARQKSLVEELAQAFESLGDSIADRVFSEASQQARQFQRQLADIDKQQQELREARVAAINPTVQRERAEQSRIQRTLEGETDVGQRIILERQLEASRQRERNVTSALGRQGGAGIGLIRQTVGEATLIAELSAFRRQNRGTPSREQNEIALQRTRDAVFSVRAGSDPFARRSQIEALTRSRDALIPATEERFFGLRTADAGRASERVRQIEELILRLQNPQVEALDSAALNIFDAGDRASRAIEQAQNAIADAIRLGVPAARLLQQQLNSVGAELERAFGDLEQARLSGDVDERTRLQADASRRIGEAAARQASLEQQADSIRRESTLDPQRQLNAILERSQSAIREVGLEGGQIARRLREIAFERETTSQQLAQLPNDPILARAAAARDQQLRQEAEALEAATSAIRTFSDALSRASQEAQQNLSAAQQAAESARRQELGFGSEQNQRAAARADADLQRQRELERRVQTEIENARSRLESESQTDPQLRQQFGRLQQIEEILGSGRVGVRRQEQLRVERDSILSALETRAQLDPTVAAARDASTREEERRQSALRGRQGLLSQGERAGEELVGQIRDLRQATRSDVAAAVRDGRFGEIDQIQARGREAEARLLSEQSRQVVPAIFSLADSVQNAVLQGPSRAALNVSDISTQEGARELNRLLRGDDPARDNTNLIELQRQSQLLEDNNRILREKLQTA